MTPVIVHFIAIIKETPFLTVKLKIPVRSESPLKIKCITCNVKLFVDFVVSVGGKKGMEIQCVGQLCGAIPAADRTTLFIRDGVTAALFCGVSTLDIQL